MSETATPPWLAYGEAETCHGRRGWLTASCHGRRSRAAGGGAQTTEDRKTGWKWRVFSIGGVIGLAFGFFYVLLPALSGLLFSEPIRLIPIPWIELTQHTEEMLPAVAQGAIGIESRSGDEATLALLAGIDDGPTQIRLAAERSFLAGLDGSCRTPIGGLAVIEGQSLWFRGEIIRPDGSERHWTERRGAATSRRRFGWRARCPAAMR